MMQKRVGKIPTSMIARSWEGLDGNRRPDNTGFVVDEV